MSEEQKFKLEDGKRLIEFVRKNINYFLNSGKRIRVPDDLKEKFGDKYGAFVTLNKYSNDQNPLRGCIGYIEPKFELYDVLHRVSVSAACEDPRFPPVSAEEMDKITDGKIKMYISSGAMVSDKNVDREKPTIFVCGTHDDFVQKFLEHEDTEIMESGVIAGANGILPAWAGNKGFAPGICLLAETLPLPMMNLDPKASKSLVSLLKDYFGIEMTYEELDKKIEEMEEALESFKKQANHIMRGERPEKGPESYFR